MKNAIFVSIFGTQFSAGYCNGYVNLLNEKLLIILPDHLITRV